MVLVLVFPFVDRGVNGTPIGASKTARLEYFFWTHIGSKFGIIGKHNLPVIFPSRHCIYYSKRYYSYLVSQEIYTCNAYPFTFPICEKIEMENFGIVDRIQS